MKEFTSDTVIGLEIHVELATESKLFCSCPTHGSDTPNSRTCPVCLGHPGSKPVLNRKAVEFALRLCLALGCRIEPELVFSRKSYFYPDMAKNYQISQYELPLGTKGKFNLGGKVIRIREVHMEEDPASLVYPGSMADSHYVMVDYNRSGDPLVEIVTEPDLQSPAEARDFMKRIITVLNYIGIFDVRRCIIKADANVSIKESGYVRSEVKNITGFREIERALKYEVERQKQDMKDGKEIVHETRAWEPAKGITFALRKKETEADYGYIIDPDLVVTEITEGWLAGIKEGMPELAEEKVRRFVKDHRISREDAEIITQEKTLAEMFEKVAAEVNPVLAAKWLRRELLRVLNYSRKQMHELEFDEKEMIELLRMVEKKEITDTVAQKILESLVEKPFSPGEYVKKEKLGAVSDTETLTRLCREAISENPKAVEDMKGGVEKSFNFLVGRVMGKTKGKASPKEVNVILRELIS